MATNKKRKKIVQFAQKCVFCGNEGVTKQHVLPNWISREYPSSKTSHTNRRGIFQGLYENLTKTPRQGPLESKKIKNVCMNCNNQWMSVLENNAKPYIKGLIDGSIDSLNTEQVKYLAGWVMLTTIILEYDERETKAVTKDDRDFLFTNLFPPLHWNVWIGKTESLDMDPSLSHRAKNLEGKNPFTDAERCNYQHTVIGIRKFAFISRSCYVPNVAFREPYGLKKMVKLWPPQAVTVTIPDWDLITDDELHDMMAHLGTPLKPQ